MGGSTSTTTATTTTKATTKTTAKATTTTKSTSTGLTGEQACEGKNQPKTKTQCEAVGCCLWAENQCWSYVFNNPCSGSKTTAKSTSTNLTGEQACEGKGLSKTQCQAVGCCSWEDGQCFSAVRNNLCSGF